MTRLREAVPGLVVPVVTLVLGIHVAVLALSALLWNPHPAPPEDRSVTFLDLAEPLPPPQVTPPQVPPPTPAPAVPQPPVSLPVPSESAAEDQGTAVPVSPAPAAVPAPAAPAEPEYLPQYQIDQVPSLPERAILDRIVYPPLAAKQGIEAVVPLYLFIDAAGSIRLVEVIKDPGFGFAEVAKKALEGLRVEPARSHGTAVAVKFRYAVRFKLK